MKHLNRKGREEEKPPSKREAIKWISEKSELLTV